ncbi:MAG: hypothetical protein ACRC8A_04875 [Microcoleaceae cyanobacterium]
MVQATQSQPELLTARQSTSVWLDPVLIRAAKQIYLSYFQVHGRQMRRPLGVVIHRETYRGMLLFTRRPILLIGEGFIPFDKIEADFY